MHRSRTFSQGGGGQAKFNRGVVRTPSHPLLDPCMLLQQNLGCKKAKEFFNIHKAI